MFILGSTGYTLFGIRIASTIEAKASNRTNRRHKAESAATESYWPVARTYVADLCWNASWAVEVFCMDSPTGIPTFHPRNDLILTQTLEHIHLTRNCQLGKKVTFALFALTLVFPKARDVR